MRIRKLVAHLRAGKTVESVVGTLPMRLSGQNSLAMFKTHEQLRAFSASAKVIEKPKPTKKQKHWVSAWTPKE